MNRMEMNEWMNEWIVYYIWDGKITTNIKNNIAKDNTIKFSERSFSVPVLLVWTNEKLDKEDVELRNEEDDDEVMSNKVQGLELLVQ